jgi:hypothetical protein
VEALDIITLIFSGEKATLPTTGGVRILGGSLTLPSQASFTDGYVNGGGPTLIVKETTPTSLATKQPLNSQGRA